MLEELGFDYNKSTVARNDLVLVEYEGPDESGLGLAVVANVHRAAKTFTGSWFEGDLNGRLKLLKGEETISFEAVWICTTRDRCFGKGKGKTGGKLLSTFKKDVNAAMSLKVDWPYCTDECFGVLKA